MSEDWAYRQHRQARRLPYRAFLLRCWQEEENAERVWRFILVKINKEPIKKGFTTLEDLFDFLQAELMKTDEGISAGM